MFPWDDFVFKANFYEAFAELVVISLKFPVVSFFFVE